MDIFFFVSLCSLGYIVYIYLMWFIRKEKTYPKFNGSYSVIIPCFNEGANELTKCVESCLKATTNGEVILVDNNSNNQETINCIKSLKNTYPQLICLHEKRQGKRFAHSKGLEVAKGDIIIFVDSDTIVEQKAFSELLKPFNNEKVGAVAGQIKVANKDTNILTNSLSAMFWTSCNIFRKATSSFGYMGVIAGALGAYRKELLLKLEPDYLNQKFLGRPCTISDDRFLTMRIQTRFKKDIEYVESAIGYTFTSTTFKQTWKMLERWRRGVIRETFLLWKEPFWNAKLLMFDVQFNFYFILLMVALKFYFIFHLVTAFSFISLIYTLVWFIIIATMYASIMVVENTKEFPYKLTWTLLYEFIFIFTFVHALWNIRSQGRWSTR